MHQLKVLSCNRNGDHRRSKHCIYNLYNRHHISCVQESSFNTRNAFDTFRAQTQAALGGRIFVSDSGATSDSVLRGKHGGVLTILHADLHGVETAQHMSELDVVNRYLVVRLQWGDRDVYIHNVYAPVDPQERTTFFSNLPRSFDPDDLHIVCGDLNSPVNATSDASTPSRIHVPSYRALRHWLWDLELVDPWRVQHKDDQVFTGPTRSNRLDYILMSHHLHELYLCDATHLDSTVNDVVVSDHLVPTLLLKAVNCDERRNPWRAPQWLLEDAKVQQWIVTFVRNHEQSIRESSNPGLAWQRVKRALRASLLQRQQSRTQPTREQLNLCKNRLAVVESSNPTNTSMVAEARAALSAAEEAHAKVQAKICFTRELLESEQSTSYFFRPPINCLSRTPISAARTDTGDITTVPWRVQYYHERFWARVFGDDDLRRRGEVDDPVTEDERQKASATLLSQVTARLPEHDNATLTSDLTIAEFENAIKGMSPYKAPGRDGIPAKVYQLDPALFARILVSVFDSLSTTRQMTSDQRQSLVCLLYKKGDRSNPANFRPICLIPVDVKIFARVLMSRLRPVIPQLVHQDQAGFVKGRHIQHPLVTLYDLQDECTRLDIDAYSVLIDFEKAYDRVSWEYLWTTMRHFGIGERYVQWVQLMYTASEVNLNVNGHILDAIRPTRGVKQGDPLSPLLFLLALEPLCCAIRSRSDLGLHLPGIPPATGMYFADDATLVTNSLANAERQLDIVQLYCVASGANLNIDKTTILPLNRSRHHHAQTRLRVLAPDDRVRYLGLPIGQNVYHSDRLTAVDAKFFSQFSIWKWRAKTVQGRVTIARALMASQLWYCSAVTSIPTTMIAHWQRALDSYIVRAQTEPSKGPLMIAREWLYSTPGRTTLRLPDVELFIQRQRINLIQQLALASAASTSEFGWYSIPLRQLASLHPLSSSAMRPLDFLWFPFDKRRASTHAKHISPWWCDVMTAWHGWTKYINLETLPPNVRQGIYLSAPIWYNKYSEWLYQPGRASRPTKQLFETTNPSVRQALASHGFASLQDFLTPDRRWPSLEQFAAMVYCTGALDNAQERNVKYLYGQLSQVFNRLLPVEVDTPPASTRGDRYNPIMPWRVETQLRCHWFPHIPSKSIGFAIASSRPTPRTRHPLLRHDTDTTVDIQQLMSHARELRKCVDPRTLDVTVRVWWRILPTHYFFWRRDSNVTLRNCAHGCPMVETYRHLFWDCTHAVKLWDVVLWQWRPALLQRPTWTHALFGLDLPLTERWQRHRGGLLFAWNVTRSIIFTILWKTRNERKHRDERPPDPLSHWPLIDSRRRLHIQHAIRSAIASDNTALRADLVRATSLLASSPLNTRRRFSP